MLRDRTRPKERLLAELCRNALKSASGTGIKSDVLGISLKDPLGRGVVQIVIARGIEVAERLNAAANDVCADIDWTVRRCRYCGCSEAHACPGGCSWIAPRVCSACAELWERDKERKHYARHAGSRKRTA